VQHSWSDSSQERQPSFTSRRVNNGHRCQAAAQICFLLLPSVLAKPKVFLHCLAAAAGGKRKATKKEREQKKMVVITETTMPDKKKTQNFPQ
jgi:hypothetical protein